MAAKNSIQENDPTFILLKSLFDASWPARLQSIHPKLLLALSSCLQNIFWETFFFTRYL